MVLVEIPTTRKHLLVIGKKELQVNADEIHISSCGVLVLKRYGNVVDTFAQGTWLRATLK